MALAEALTLCRYKHWKVFGTGTFTGSATPGDAAQRKLVFAFLYETAKISGVPFGRLVWTARREYGELGGRAHWHWLIGDAQWQPTLGELFTLNAAWDKLPRCGFSRNRQFDPALNGVDYVTKCLGGSASSGPGLGGDHYESGKFALSSTEVILSNSLARTVRGSRVFALRHCSQTHPENIR